MSNQVLIGFEAIKEIIASMTKVDQEALNKQAELRTSLNTLTKAQLIEMIMAEKSRSIAKEPTQRDLICAILKDERCRVLDYTEISECILENMNTKLKYSPANLAWYKSQLTTEGEELVARMSPADRRKLDRQIAMEAMKNLQ